MDYILERHGGSARELSASSECKQVFEDLPVAVEAILSGLALMHCFLGVSIVSDIFMSAIEVITSQRRQVVLDTGQLVTVKVWNDTVANLTLMALGSSAPEILLAVTELFGREMYAGVLGPATIVGSASFNLLMIIALCIFVIPSSETRKVLEMPVFFITTIFMFIAYGWVLFVISGHTADIVDIWEAVVTLLFLPVLVSISYAADIGLLGDCGKTMDVRSEDVNCICELLGDFERSTMDAITAGIAEDPLVLDLLDEPTAESLEKLRTMVKKHVVVTKSRAIRRMEATRLLTGSKKIQWEKSPTDEHSLRIFGITKACIQDVPLALPRGHGPPIVQFACESQCMSEGMTCKTILVTRSGDCSEAIEVNLGVTTVARPTQRPEKRKTWLLRQASASSFVSSTRSSETSAAFSRKSTYSSASTSSLGSGRKTLQRQGSSSLRSPRIRNSFEQTEIASFEAGQEFVSIQIPAPSGVAIDGDSNMFAVSLLDVTSETSGSTEVTLGDINKTLVILRRGDIAGRLCFPYTQLLIQGSAEQMTLEILVQRKENCQGPATCNFRTERLSAVPGYDYEPLEGEISFEAGATEAFINVEILPKQGLVQTDFILILTDPDGCDFDPSTDGGIENEILTIVVGPADLLCSTFSTKVLMWFDKGFNLNQLRLGNAEYMEQFTGAFFVNGSLAEQRDASAMDWCFHIICLPWKLTFMFVPPPAYCHGWVCFWMSMVAIAGMTYMIGDLAEVFGCAIGMPDLLTAISVVALGTSMPDLFASRTAAIQDSSADASIVNVTGSNCVNVFLGLGLPWLIGSIYWRVAAWDPRWEAEYPEVASVQRGESVMKFVVRAGDLGFSVIIFFICAVLAITILMFRRRRIGAELGGPFEFKLASSVALATLWFTYIGLSGWWTLRQDKASDFEKMIVFIIGAVAMLVPISVCFCCGYKQSVRLTMRSSMGYESSMREGEEDKKYDEETTEAFSIGLKKGSTNSVSSVESAESAEPDKGSTSDSVPPETMSGDDLQETSDLTQDPLQPTVLTSIFEDVPEVADKTEQSKNLYVGETVHSFEVSSLPDPNAGSFPSYLCCSGVHVTNEVTI